MNAFAKSTAVMFPPEIPRTESGVFLSTPTLALRAVGLQEARQLSQRMPIIVLIPEVAPNDHHFSLCMHILGYKPANAEVQYSFGEVVVNFSAMEATRKGQSVFLRPMEFKTLRYFVKNARRVISRDELLNAVWGYENYPCTRTVDNHILQLRQKLEKDPSRPMHIQTVHGAGYKFVP